VGRVGGFADIFQWRRLKSIFVSKSRAEKMFAPFAGIMGYVPRCFIAGERLMGAIGRGRDLFFERYRRPPCLEWIGWESLVYPITVTCHRLGIDPAECLRDVLKRLPSATNHQIPELTPAGKGNYGAAGV